MKPEAKSFSRSAALIGAMVVAGTLLVVSGASAQQPAPGDSKELAPPVPTPPNKLATNYLALLEAFVLGALVVGVNFIPSKRGHQD